MHVVRLAAIVVISAFVLGVGFGMVFLPPNIPIGHCGQGLLFAPIRSPVVNAQSLLALGLPWLAIPLVFLALKLLKRAPIRERHDDR